MVLGMDIDNLIIKRPLEKELWPLIFSVYKYEPCHGI
jgi:hypothetical protein